MGVAAADLGGSATAGAAGGVGNVMIVRRDVGSATQVKRVSVCVQSGTVVGLAGRLLHCGGVE